MNFKLIAIGSAVLLTAACTTTDPYTGQTSRNNTLTGAGLGAAAGAALGYLTNTNDSEEGRQNALIGAGVGALAGAAVGNYMDRQQQQLQEELAGTGVEVDRRGENIVLNMPGNITFGFDQSNIQQQFYPVLNDVSRTLNEYEQTTIDVIGHTDSVGSDAYNQALSERRASAVAQYLVNQGVLADRIYVAGRGESEPIASNETEEGRARNRRVEIILRPLTTS